MSTNPSEIEVTEVDAAAAAALMLEPLSTRVAEAPFVAVGSLRLTADEIESLLQEMQRRVAARTTATAALSS